LLVMKDEYRLEILQKIHRSLQDTFVYMGTFNQVLQDWKEATRYFIKRDGNTNVYMMTEPSGVATKTQIVIFDDKEENFIARWTKWMTVVRPLLAIWMEMD
jgi:hypothetical protein